MNKCSEADITVADGPVDRDGESPGGQEAVKRFARWANLFWKCLGCAALAVSLWLLFRELRSLSIAELQHSLSGITPYAWVGAAGATLAAYAFLAGYDHVALRHLGKKIDPVFVTVCAAATYAFSHTVGASVFSGAVLRYRAYTAKGLSGAEIGALVVFCTVTFSLGVAIVCGVAFVSDPFIIDRFVEVFPLNLSASIGKLLLGAAAIYLICSLLPFPELRLGSLKLAYPSFSTALLQIGVGSAELVCAALVIYVSLPAASNPGFLTVMGIFVLSFCAAMISHSPGGFGVFELLFLNGLSEMAAADVLAALLVFRLFYFLLPFIGSLVVIIVFEMRKKTTSDLPSRQ